MNYVYHGVPETMFGNELVPLNAMRGDMEDIAKLHRQKYDGRESVMQRRIPLLNCLWNDVVQFLPVDPEKVFSLQVALGLLREIPHYRFYKIDISTIALDNTVVYFKDTPGEDSAHVKWLQDVDFSDLQTIPPATERYYRTLLGKDELPFNFQFIPHVLHQGNVDISQATVITL